MASEPLRQLIALDGDCQVLLEDAQRYLRSAPGSQESVAVLLTLDDIDRALRRFEEGVLSGDQLQRWAEVLEMNDRVRYEPGFDEAISDILFRLATPEINDPIDQAVVEQLRASISRLHRR